MTITACLYLALLCSPPEIRKFEGEFTFKTSSGETHESVIAYERLPKVRVEIGSRAVIVCDGESWLFVDLKAQEALRILDSKKQPAILAPLLAREIMPLWPGDVAFGRDLEDFEARRKLYILAKDYTQFKEDGSTETNADGASMRTITYLDPAHSFKGRETWILLEKAGKTETVGWSYSTDAKGWWQRWNSSKEIANDEALFTYRKPVKTLDMTDRELREGATVESKTWNERLKKMAIVR